MVSPEINYQITFDPLEDKSQLASEWKALEARANNDFFLSWLWISTWLNVFSPDVRVLRATDGVQVVALALITNNLDVRHRWLRSNVLRMHQTGKSSEDQIWIEYNGMLVASEHAGNAERACADYLLTKVKGWDELVLGAVLGKQLEGFTNEGLFEHTLWSAPSYGVDLEHLRQQKQEYIQSLSKNTRYQLRRARRCAEAMGQVSFSLAESVGQALAEFTKIAVLHKSRWGDESGFNNDDFIAFHKALISKAMPLGCVEIFSMEIDGRKVAYLYNFIYRDKVYFYLSGVNYSGIEAVKPGLLCHAECIKTHQVADSKYYDFMSGGARYKQSLGAYSGELYVTSFQKKTMSMWLENKLRWLKGIGSRE